MLLPSVSQARLASKRSMLLSMVHDSVVFYPFKMSAIGVVFFLLQEIFVGLFFKGETITFSFGVLYFEVKAMSRYFEEKVGPLKRNVIFSFVSGTLIFFCLLLCDDTVESLEGGEKQNSLFIDRFELQGEL